MADNSYILITAAYNEASMIENTIKSVITQKTLPSKWIIVNDGSIDDTECIVENYARDNNFIELITRVKKEGRDFASKVSAIRYGLNKVDLNDINFIGILDADVSFDSYYFASIIDRFNSSPKLGIAGGSFFDIYKGKKYKIWTSKYSVRGAAQLFRKECFQQIGGLLPLKYGGEDGVACIAARMHGWEITNFEELVVLHHRRTGSADKNIFKRRFRDGIVEYSLGYHPLFQFIKCVSRVFKEKPYVLASLLRLFGFWWASFKREERIIPNDIIKYTRKEQLQRILRLSY